MIIGNLKSSQDLASKRNLQRELLELEIANESELERRVKDFKDPNKPIPVAPKFRTNAELQKDRIDQERIAIKNMEDLGFDYNKGADLVGWLSGSDIDRLVEFNANFKGIKKELTETTNPRLLTLDYIKNYLERFFEDLDVSFGRKMTGQTGMMVSTDVSIDELQSNLPQESTIYNLLDIVRRVLDELRKINADANVDLNGKMEQTEEILADYPILSQMYQELENIDEEDRRVRTRGVLKKSEIEEIKREIDIQKSIFDDLTANNASSSEINIQRGIVDRLTQSLSDTTDEYNEIAGITQNLDLDAKSIKEKIKQMRDKPRLYREARLQVGDKKKRALKRVNKLENKIDEIKKIHEKGLFSSGLLSLLGLVIPSDEFLNIFKVSLPLLQRTELVKRYARLLARLKAPTEQSLLETLSEAREAIQQTEEGNLDFANYLFTKINKMLSFLSLQKNTDAVASLNRNYEAEIAKTDKTGDLQKIKQINDRNEAEIAELKAQMKNIVNDAILDLESAVLSKNPAGRAIEGRKSIYNIQTIENASEIEMEGDRLARQGRLRDMVSGIFAEEPSQIQPRKSLKSLYEGRLLSKKIGEMDDVAIIEETDFVDYISSLPENEILPELIRLRENAETRVLAEEMLKRAGFSNVLSKFSSKIKGKKTRKEEEEMKKLEEEGARQIDEHKANMIQYYESLLDEVESENSDNVSARLITMRKLAEKLYGKRDHPRINKTRIPQTRSNNAEREDAIKEYRDAIVEWLITNRIQDPLYGENVEYEPADITRPDKIVADIYSFDKTKRKETTRGFGLSKSLKKHFRDDEKELREMANDLNRHKREEEKIDKSVDFKHKRIKVGRGVELNEEPTYRTFGKYVIHMKHLKGKGVANFKYPSLGSIPSIKPKPITEEYKEFIIDVLETGKPNERQFRRLNDDEREHFERVCLGAGLLDHFRMKRTGDDEDKERVDRFNILRGEVLAGNNNENVIKELRGLVVRFINEGRITRQEGTNMLMELSAL